MLKKIVGVLIPKQYTDIIISKVNKLFSHLNNHNFPNTTFLIIITSISWLFYISAIFYLSESINLGISYWQVGLFFILSSIIALVPISIAGIGTRDLALIVLFSEIGYAKEDAISFSIIILIMYLFTAIIGLISWLINHEMKIIKY